MIDETFEDIEKDLKSNEFRSFVKEITTFEKIVLISFGFLFFASLFSLVIITIYFRSVTAYIIPVIIIVVSSIVLKLLVKRVTNRTK